MAGESQRTPESTPDPTVYVQEAIDRASKSEREWVGAQLAVRDQRLTAIDKATELLNETVNRTPTDIQKEILHLRELTSERFDSIALQFTERDVRSERESKDNVKAVNAAFAAQKEAAAKEGESNQKSIDKTERQFKETIDKMAELFRTTTDALARQISDKYDTLLQQSNDHKTRLDRSEARANGNTEQKTEHRDAGATTRAIIASAIGIVLFLVTIAGFVIALSVKP